ncbi:hypothetical protein [Pusillimonas sp.]|uniref:hypothetical protein n=1 Tax=Pusillimonas sp. TaxID=3040095 RepID=UPI0037C89BD1
MPASTPIARSKTAALIRITDLVAKGYDRYTHGKVAASKAQRLAQKLHAKYGIGCTPAQRITRKKHGLANTAMVLYWPEGAETVEWLMLATQGDGLGEETLEEVARKRIRLIWLGYQLVRRSHRGRIAWTWKLPRQTMADHYNELHALLNSRHYATVGKLLERASHYPGFHGIREQLKPFLGEAQRRGYMGQVPHLFYVRKISHGERLLLDGSNA